MPDYEDSQLQQISQRFGPKVAQEVFRCWLEVEEWNPSGRYPVQIPWNFDHQRPMTAAEIVAFLAQKHNQKKRRGRPVVVNALPTFH